MQWRNTKAQTANTPGLRKKCIRHWLTVALALTAFLVMGSVPPTHAQSYNVLYSFDDTHGLGPTGYLVRDGTGNLYSTTAGGGSANGGTVFQWFPGANGGETVSYNFADGSDGGFPIARPVMDTSGNLYGTTSNGGDFNTTNCSTYGCGVVYKVAPCCTQTVLYTFTGGSDGGIPDAGLIMDASGNLYGVTNQGGAVNTTNCGASGCGVVFKVDPAGNETVLYTFTGSADGAGPEGGHLIMDASGNLYGTTAYGGTFNNTHCPYGCGTVFKLDTHGRETVLHSFTGDPDRATPFSGLLMDPSGNLYGTTASGGTANNTFCPFGCGTVFKLDNRSHETVLYRFTGANGDGASPYGTVVMDGEGNFYGTTQIGGNVTVSGVCADGCGTVYVVSPSGSETVLHTFGTAANDGEIPQSDLYMDASGDLYGTTLLGGALSTTCSSPGCGTIFEVTPSTLVPFSAVGSNVTVKTGRSPGFQLSGSFALGTGGPAIDPVTSGMMLGVANFPAYANYVFVIPAGLFKVTKKG